MRNLPFHILWPGGNTTALVSELIAREAQPSIAKKIMQENPTIEQVGFFELPTTPGADARLQMMGGEFCGNATRAAAFYYIRSRGKDQSINTVEMEVSGLNKLLPVVTDSEQTKLQFSPDFFVKATETPDGLLVDLLGIRHLIIMSESSVSDSELINRYGVDVPALGLIKVKPVGDTLCIDPHVWVREIGSLVPETGCASGSAATAIAASIKSGKEGLFHIKQPSGEVYLVNLEYSKKVLVSITLTGIVKYLGEGSINIEY